MQHLRNWLLRKRGKSVKESTNALLRLDVAAKNELLFHHGVNFSRLPAWQRRGVGLYWETYAKAGFNPKSGIASKTSRRRVRIDTELPVKEAYQEFLRHRIAEAVA